MATTIHDVARVAGVGIGTVSRVINNNSGVRETTRDKVLLAVQQLKFQPDPIARSMVSRRTGSIGVVVPFFTRPFFMEVLRSMEMALEHYGSDFMLYNVKTNAQRDRYFSELPMRRKVDGLLVLSLPLDDSAARNFRDVGLPVVLVDAYSPLLTSLVVNNVEGAYTAVQFLIEQGHRRIGFINGITEGNFKFNQANDRLIGFHRAFGEANLQFEPELVVLAGWNRKGGREAALHLLSQEHRPTALFVASDIQAAGALEAARQLGIPVPNALSIIGYDGIELSEILALSTIQQPMQQMGKLGVQKLMEQIENPQQSPELFRFGTMLAVRSTTAPLVRH